MVVQRETETVFTGNANVWGGALPCGFLTKDYVPCRWAEQCGCFPALAPLALLACMVLQNIFPVNCYVLGYSAPDLFSNWLLDLLQAVKSNLLLLRVGQVFIMVAKLPMQRTLERQDLF